MNIQIKMLNVGDGDAMVIKLKRSETDQLIILIDAGHSSDAPAVIKVLDTFLEQSNKKGPDLIICTHYDADHIGGMNMIAENYKTNIGQVWIHQPGIQQAALILAEEVIQSRINPAAARMLDCTIKCIFEML